MIFSMRSDCMTLSVGTSHEVGAAMRHTPNHEKGRSHAVRRQRFEDAGCVRGQWTIVKSQHNFTVTEGKRLSILRSTDALVFVRVNDNDTASSRSIGMARAFACIGNRCSLNE